MKDVKKNMDSEEDCLKLGGSIELSGFSCFDGGAIIILKKIIGNYARKMSDNSKGFESLKLRVKKVHDHTYELNCQMIDAGNMITSSVEDRNIFVAVDTALKKINEQL